MDKQALKQICAAMPKTRILVIGDIILDHFVYGSVNRISPESPVPVLSKKRDNAMLGGAGNSFANLIGLQTDAVLLSVIGDDREGQQLRDLMVEKGGAQTHFIIDPTRPTSTKTRFLAGHQQLLRTDFESTAPIDDSVATQLLNQFDTLLPDMQCVVLSDYGKGILRPDVIAHMIKQANVYDIPVIVDPKGNDFSIYRGAYAVTPNRKELSDATRGHVTDTDEDVVNASRLLLQQSGVKSVIATRSQDGISVITSDPEDIYHIRPTDQVEVYDVSGAGDTVIATIAATIASGGTLEHAAHLGNIAGHIAVTKVGTTPIRLNEMEHALSQDGFSANDGTLMGALLTEDEAVERIARWRARGLKIGFTNGCFDIIHAGHVSYLNETRQHCDRLIVGLNSDSSVKVLKGESRPIHDEAARATVLGALASVDSVVLFGAKKHGDDNTANALINALKPDVYFKGGDYKIHEIPETPTVQAYGGEVKVLQVVEGYSTTQAIEKAKQPKFFCAKTISIRLCKKSLQ